MDGFNSTSEPIVIQNDAKKALLLPIKAVSPKIKLPAPALRELEPVKAEENPISLGFCRITRLEPGLPAPA